ncbi:YoaK family protein [Pantoea stewartii]|uniref:YoaK family protein n=1 Tax=Pantoea stewartii TaxID=66269 RepID=UPI001980CB2F|nr:YoaK family protein [Pantoea stewartii]
MLIKKKKLRSHTEDRYLALALATTAGILNAMALGAFGFFPSHMSGNTSQISTEVFTSDFDSLIFLAGLIMAFVVGCTSARLFIIAGERRKIRTVFCQIILAEGIALTSASLFEKMFYSPEYNGEVLLMLAFLMGLHNATSTQLSNGRVRSTHITGTLTDAGIALGTYVSSFVSRAEPCDRRFAQKQLHTHLTTVFSFLSGCIVGLILFKAYAFNAMIALGIFLIILATCAILIALNNARKF